MCLPMSRTSFPCQMNASGQPMAVLQQDALKQWIQSSTSFPLDPLVPWIKLLLFFLMLNFNGSFQWIRGVTNFGDQSTSAKCLEKIIFGCTLVDNKPWYRFMTVEWLSFLTFSKVARLSSSYWICWWRPCRHILCRGPTSQPVMQTCESWWVPCCWHRSSHRRQVSLWASLRRLAGQMGSNGMWKVQLLGVATSGVDIKKEHQKRLPTQHLTSASHLTFGVDKEGWSVHGLAVNFDTRQYDLDGKAVWSAFKRISSRYSQRHSLSNHCHILSLLPLLAWWLKVCRRDCRILCLWCVVDFIDISQWALLPVNLTVC